MGTKVCFPSKRLSPEGPCLLPDFEFNFQLLMMAIDVHSPPKQYLSYGLSYTQDPPAPILDTYPINNSYMNPNWDYTAWSQQMVKWQMSGLNYVDSNLSNASKFGKFVNQTLEGKSATIVPGNDKFGAVLDEKGVKALELYWIFWLLGPEIFMRWYLDERNKWEPRGPNKHWAEVTCNGLCKWHVKNVIFPAQLKTCASMRLGFQQPLAIPQWGAIASPCGPALVEMRSISCSDNIGAVVQQVIDLYFGGPLGKSLVQMQSMCLTTQNIQLDMKALQFYHTKRHLKTKNPSKAAKFSDLRSLNGIFACAIPGIGPASYPKLVASLNPTFGYVMANQILDKFLQESKEGFKYWLFTVCGASDYHANDCYNALRDWCIKNTVAPLPLTPAGG